MRGWTNKQTSAETGRNVGVFSHAALVQAQLFGNMWRIPRHLKSLLRCEDRYISRAKEPGAGGRVENELGKLWL